MIRKLSLQWRLTILSALILTICCVGLDLVIMNSAILKMDDVGSAVMYITLTESEDVITLDVPSVAPEITQALDVSKEAFRRNCLIATCLVILGGTGLTWFLSGIAMKPLKKLNRQISDISASNLSVQVPETGGSDEIAVLTHSFNRMLQRLEEAFSSQKQFSANAAHELRTPLAILQTNLEVFAKKEEHTQNDYNEMVNTTLKQTEHMNHLISSLLELMSLHTATLTDEIELVSLTDEILCDLDPLAKQKSVTLSHSGTDCHLRGNEVLLYRAIYNLTENAIKYNCSGGAVEIVISNDLPSRAIVTVSDTGSGIPKENWEEIWQPFYRLDKSRSRSMGGVGLGLALVNDIALLHNGKVYVLDSTASGTRICLELPTESC